MCQKPLHWKIFYCFRACVFEFGGSVRKRRKKCENVANTLFGIRKLGLGPFFKPIKYKALMGHFHAYLHNGKAKVLFIGGSWIFKRSHGAAVRNSGATKVHKYVQRLALMHL